MSPLLPIAIGAAFMLLMRGNKKPTKTIPPLPPADGSSGDEDDGGQGSGFDPPDIDPSRGPGKIRQDGPFPGPKGKPQGQSDIVPGVFQWPGADGGDAQPAFEPDPIEWIKSIPASDSPHEVLLATGIPKGHYLVNLRFQLRTETVPSYGQLELLTYHLHLTNAAPDLKLVASKLGSAGLRSLTLAMFGCTKATECGIVRSGYHSYFEPRLRWANGGLELTFETRRFAPSYHYGMLRAHAVLTLERGTP